MDIVDHTINRHPRQEGRNATWNRINLPPTRTREAPPIFQRGEDEPPPYLRNLPTHLPHPLTLWQAMEEPEISTNPEVVTAEIAVFPFNFREQWRGDGRSIAPTLIIIRPYREVIELLQFGNRLMLFLMECQTGPNWEHEAFPLTYISTLESLLPLPNHLWNSYSELADLQPVTCFPLSRVIPHVPRPRLPPILPPR
jgi:hypothetical protein